MRPRMVIQRRVAMMSHSGPGQGHWQVVAGSNGCQVLVVSEGMRSRTCAQQRRWIQCALEQQCISYCALHSAMMYDG